MSSRKTFLLMPLMLVSMLVAAGCKEGSTPRETLIPTAGAKEPAAEFHFAVLADRCGGARKGVFELGLDELNLLQPDFVMMVGDMVEGYTDDRAKLKAQWDELDTLVGRLQMPLYYTVGNHDINKKPQRDMWPERYGRPYYSFVHKDALFVVLNTQDEQERIGPVQQEYLRKTLAAHANVKWTFVFLHNPLWTASPDRQKNNGWPQVQAAMKGRQYTVFAGHTHTYDASERDGAKYFVLCTTGGANGMEGLAAGQFDHLMWVTMTEKGPVFANLMLEGIYGPKVGPYKVAIATSQPKPKVPAGK